MGLLIWCVTESGIRASLKGNFGTIGRARRVVLALGHVTMLHCKDHSIALDIVFLS
jgi:hypothetical protein